MLFQVQVNMKRKKWWIALLLLLPMALVTVLFARWQRDARTEPEPVEEQAAAPSVQPMLDSMLAELHKGPEMAGRLDESTRLSEAPGWPFQKLPLVAKFAPADSQVEEVVVPIDSIIRYAPLLDSVLQPVHTPTATEPLAPLWVLPPLAMAALVTRADVTAVSVIPEPGTLVLLSVGIVLLVSLTVIRSRRTRRGDRGAHVR
jgi:hypothetical protein